MAAQVMTFLPLTRLVLMNYIPTMALRAALATLFSLMSCLALAAESIRLATTTSTYNSGLLGHLLSAYGGSAIAARHCQLSAPHSEPSP